MSDRAESPNTTSTNAVLPEGASTPDVGTDAAAHVGMRPESPLPWCVLGNQGTALWAGDSIVSSAVEARTHHRMARADALYAAHAANAYPKLVEALKDNAALWACPEDIALLRELGEIK